MQKRCPNCFNELGTRAKKCPKCSLVLSEANNNGFLPVGTILNDRYYIGKIFKIEPVSVVYLAYDAKNNVKVLIREFTAECFLNGEFKPTIPRERLIDRFLSYSKSIATLNLCKIFPRTIELFVWQNNAYAVYSFFDAESLKFLLENGTKISKPDIIKIAKKLCGELVILHNSHMIYGALSPDTIYITDSGEIFVFGVGSPFYEFVTDIDDRAKVLNPEFCAPEVFLNNKSRGTYSDVYSLSAIIYYLLLKNPLPISFLRCKGETIEVPNKVDSSIEKSLSTALLNGLNWQIEVRTKTLNAFYSELISVKNNRRLSPMILLADALGVFWYCYGKAKVGALKTFDIIKNKFLKFKNKVKQPKNKATKKRLWIWITVLAVLLIALLAFMLFGNSEQKGVLNPNKTNSHTADESWFYGSGNSNTDNSSKKSFLDIFGVESKTSSKQNSKDNYTSVNMSSDAESVSSNSSNQSSSKNETSSTSQNTKPVFSYSYNLKTMPIVTEMDFEFTGKEPLVIEYEADSSGTYKILGYDDSSDGATLLVNIREKNQNELIKNAEISGENGTEINVNAGAFYVEIFTQKAPKDMKEISLSWAYVESGVSACKLLPDIPSVTNVNNGEAVFNFSLSKPSLINVTPAEACAYETDCNFYIKNSSGEKVTDSIMIHGTEWISRKVLLPKGDYTLIVTELRSMAVCNIKIENYYDNVLFSNEITSELPVLFGYTSVNKGERRIKFNADEIDGLVIKADGEGTYYDSEQTAEIKVVDSNGNTLKTKICEGEIDLDTSELIGECTLIITADGSCVVEVLENN